MFTGIIQSIGTLKNKHRIADIIKLTIDVPWEDIQLGESIAINGVCLTVTSYNYEKKTINVDMSHETIKRTALGKIEIGEDLNLERALQINDRLGGHIVLGHVDGIGKIITVKKLGQSYQLYVSYPEKLSQYIATKGSIAINGVSLTVNEVLDDMFSVTIIPFTWNGTNLQYLKPKKDVNLEVDIISRYLMRFLEKSKIDSNSLEEKLKKHGFF